MLSGQDLAAALASLPAQPFSGSVYRMVPVKYILSRDNPSPPLTSIGSLKGGGRFNPMGTFEILYTSGNPYTVAQEVRFMQEREGVRLPIRKPPQVFLSIDCNLQRVLDLTNSEFQERLSANLQELIGEWRIEQGDGKLAPTQELGLKAYESEQIEALKVPSKHDVDRFNLNIFPDRLLLGSYLQVYDPDDTVFSDRLPRS